ncbi:conjugal transfer protein TraG [Campylobacter jejuni]|uniref:Conjugal transfer protein TraG n=2 Tax=Campylobacter jejuni TaxID=197 RepID=A0A5T0Y8T5_CAMJU|nr:TraC family protein [Campylobacter jejuni]EAI6536416.1 conjugal transfer protein TraG [Campylobacter coli]EAH4699783.1 conjugal transfer protein TraG [Campylobacter jejuni]EAH4710073.1 conjugal transfer protein TraG [Campylobacter jejuni]EAH4718903.1 conjugal transfer protein TraG [Campylobacter jejuni]EAH5853178.1 conjugal transfer protein TraG [Campylobacter jejuni]
MSLSDFINEKLGINQSVKKITSLQTNVWNACMQRYKFSDFLPYMSYDSQKEYYINNDNSFGTVFLCSPRIRMGESTAVAVEEMLGKLPENMFIQFTLFGSKNIKDIVEYWKYMHLERADRENNELLFKAIKNMEEFYYSKTKEGISSSMTTRLKNYYLLVSIKSNSEEDVISYKHILKNILTSNNFSPVVAEPEVLKPMLYELFNGNHDINNIPNYDRTCYLNRQVIMPTTEILIKDDELKIDGRSFISLTPQSFPQEAHIGDFGEKLGDYISRALDNNQFKDTFLITASVCALSKKKTARVKGNHSMLLTQKWSENIFRQFAAARKESVSILERIDNQKEKLYAFDLNVIVSGDNYNEASLNASTIISYWNKGGGKAIVLDEALGIHQLNLIASLPMGINKEYMFDITVKYRSMFPDQISQFIPLEADFKLNIPNLILFSRRAQIAGLDLFVSSSNYNAYLVATSGAGKSVLLNMLAFNSYARNDRIFIIDQDNSFINICDAVGGQYLALDPSKPISFNPFSGLKNNDRDSFAEDLEYLSRLIYMLGSSKNQDRALEDERLIKAKTQAIMEELFLSKGNTMEVTDIRDELAKVDDQRFRDFADQLRPFCKEGIYGKYFNGPCEFNIEKEFIVTEFKGLEGYDDLKDPLIMLLIYHINQLMYMSTDRKSRIQIIIDEAHRFLGKNPKMDDFIEQAYRRARKYGASAIIATQGFDDIYNAKDGGLSRAGTVIVNNSAYKIFMKQTETSVNMLIKSEVFSLSETDKEILRSIRTIKGEYSELFLMTPDDVKLPYRLVVDKYFYYLTTTDATDKAKIKELTDQGIPLGEAIDLLANTKTKSNEAK